MNAFTGADILVSAPRVLVEKYLDLDDAVSRHYAVCYDQREQFDCRECRELNQQRYEARKAMEADDAAMTFYQSPEATQQRRERSRYVRQFYDDTERWGNDD